MRFKPLAYFSKYLLGFSLFLSLLSFSGQPVHTQGRNPLVQQTEWVVWNRNKPASQTFLFWRQGSDSVYNKLTLHRLFLLSGFNRLNRVWFKTAEHQYDLFNAHRNLMVNHRPVAFSSEELPSIA